MGFACFCTGKWDFGRWDRDLSQKKKWEWDWSFLSISVGSGHWLVGFGKKWLPGNGIGNPPSRPSFKSVHFSDGVVTHDICHVAELRWWTKVHNFDKSPS